MNIHSSRVGDVAQQIRGVTFAKSDAVSRPTDGYVPVLRAGNIQDAGLSFEDLVYVPSERVSAKQRLRENDVVIAASSGSLSVVGKAARSLRDFDGGFGAFCKVLRPGDEVDPAYFAHYFQTPGYRRKASALAEGANINNLKNEHLDDMVIPLPPLSEQRRIAAILDQADALRAKRRQALARLNDLTLAIFYEMFGSPDRAPVTRAFGEVAGLTGGRNLIADDSTLCSPYRVLKISAVTSGYFKANESKPLPSEYVPPTAHLIRPGDLLMSRANTTELVGSVAMVDEAPDNLALPDKIWRFDWREDASVPAFYHALFQTPWIRRRISRLSSGTGGSMKNVSKAKLESMPIPVVDPSQQEEFAARVMMKSAQRKRVDVASSTEDELFRALQSRAFRGEL